MRLLLTSDLHLTDRPKDQYRFGLFEWLCEQQALYKPDATFILGDLTEFKDRHSAKLTNEIMDGLMALVAPVYILRGNHDGVDPNNPFFRFVNHTDGVRLIVRPLRIKPWAISLIPHQRTQADFEEACHVIKPGDLVFCHQTFEGAQAESGRRLSGLSASPIEFRGPAGIWAGDVHKPQQCGPVTYLGAPYHVRFGDNFTPRCLLMVDDTDTDLQFPAPRKWSLTVRDADNIINDKRLRKGDQAKLTIQLIREDVLEWPAYKARCLEACKQKGLDVFGAEMEVLEGKLPKAKINENSVVNPKDVFKEYCKAEGLATDVRAMGLEFL